MSPAIYREHGDRRDSMISILDGVEACGKDLRSHFGESDPEPLSS